AGRTGVEARFITTRGSSRLPLRPDRSANGVSLPERNQPEIDEIAPGLHEAPPAIFRSWVATGAPVPTYTTTVRTVRAPSASVAMKEISCSPRSDERGLQLKSPVFASNTDS